MQKPPRFFHAHRKTRNIYFVLAIYLYLCIMILELVLHNTCYTLGNKKPGAEKRTNEPEPLEAITPKNRSHLYYKSRPRKCKEKEVAKMKTKRNRVYVQVNDQRQNKKGV